MSTYWTLETIQAMIDSGREEALTLEYKASAALFNNKELAKDVSAFANSDGGTIIYGVVEEGHKPIRIDDGVDPRQKTKEAIENTLIDSIQPRILNLKIHPIDLPSGNQIFALEIPKSNQAPHMARHSYYKRYNFQSVSMEHYEVLDVMNRKTGPDLTLLFSLRMEQRENDEDFPLVPNIQNLSKNPADCALVTLWLDKRLVDHEGDPRKILSRYFNNIHLNGSAPLEPISDEKIWAYKGIVVFKPTIPIFSSKSFMLFDRNHGVLPLKLPKNESGVILNDYYIQWEIEAPDMPSKKVLERFSIKEVGGRSFSYEPCSIPLSGELNG